MLRVGQLGHAHSRGFERVQDDAEHVQTKEKSFPEAVRRDTSIVVLTVGDVSKRVVEESAEAVVIVSISDKVAIGADGEADREISVGERGSRALELSVSCLRNFWLFSCVSQRSRQNGSVKQF